MLVTVIGSAVGRVTTWKNADRGRWNIMLCWTVAWLRRIIWAAW